MKHRDSIAMEALLKETSEKQSMEIAATAEQHQQE
jgi:hypothetical protein